MKNRRNKWLIFILLAITSIIFMFPFFEMLSISLMSFDESISIPPKVLPSTTLFSNYSYVFTKMNFNTMFLNSFITTSLRVLGTIATCSVAGYVFAKIKFPGNKLLFSITIAIMLVPGYMFLLPQYYMMSEMGWLNTLAAIIVPNVFSAYGIFFMRQFFKSIPDSLIEAAYLDGLNHFKIFYKICLPLVKPGLMVLTIQTTVGAWNDLMWPMIINSDSSKFTLPVGIAMMAGQRTTIVPYQMAAGIMVVIPMVVLYICTQKYFQNIDLSLK
ncbi:MAG: carbohydrate ABC transporter permease [Erysipelotrichaceae bacterium]